MVAFLPTRIKPVQRSQGITNGTSGGIGQQQATALCDISAQVQQYQPFLGEQQMHRYLQERRRMGLTHVFLMLHFAQRRQGPCQPLWTLMCMIEPCQMGSF